MDNSNSQEDYSDVDVYARYKDIYDEVIEADFGPLQRGAPVKPVVFLPYSSTRPYLFETDSVSSTNLEFEQAYIEDSNKDLELAKKLAADESAGIKPAGPSHPVVNIAHPKLPVTPPKKQSIGVSWVKLQMAQTPQALPHWVDKRAYKAKNNHKDQRRQQLAKEQSKAEACVPSTSRKCYDQPQSLVSFRRTPAASASQAPQAPKPKPSRAKRPPIHGRDFYFHEEALKKHVVELKKNEKNLHRAWEREAEMKREQ